MPHLIFLAIATLLTFVALRKCGTCKKLRVSLALLVAGLLFSVFTITTPSYSIAMRAMTFLIATTTIGLVSSDLQKKRSSSVTATERNLLIAILVFLVFHIIAFLYAIFNDNDVLQQVQVPTEALLPLMLDDPAAIHENLMRKYANTLHTFYMTMIKNKRLNENDPRFVDYNNFFTRDNTRDNREILERVIELLRSDLSKETDSCRRDNISLSIKKLTTHLG